MTAANATCAQPRDPPRPGFADDLGRDLAAAVEGEVRFSRGDRALYAFDASVFQQLPLGVIVPRHAEDEIAALAVRRRYGAPVFDRGCGTALAAMPERVGQAPVRYDRAAA